jgi:hypothetical protein
MLDVTLRLDGRTFHLVHRAGDCDSCRNRRRHTPVNAGPFLRASIARAVWGDAAALASLRELVAMDVAVPPSRSAIDSEIVKHVDWLLETARVLVVECVEVRRELPDVVRRQAPRPPSRPRPEPIEDLKTWIAIELLEEKTNRPVSGARYIVKGPSGTFAGTLDGQGRARVDSVDPGTYDVSFPDFDGREWKKA